MSEPYTLRPARPTIEDARALLAVERASLADSPYTPAEVLAVLARPEHRAWLALAGEDTVGFLSSLETPTPSGPRLELDMLGVRPEHRGRGLATRLMGRALADAAECGVRLARGVVREDNLPSQRAFLRAGLCAGAAPREMRVYPIGGTSPLPLPAGYAARLLDPAEAALPADGGAPFRPAGAGSAVLAIAGSGSRTLALAAYLHVHTLAYEGLWIERLWAATAPALRAALRAVIEEAKRLSLDEVGHLAPSAAPSEPDLRTEWLREGFIPMGRYLVYQREAPGSSVEDRART